MATGRFEHRDDGAVAEVFEYGGSGEPVVKHFVEFVGGPRDGDRQTWTDWLGDKIHVAVDPEPSGAYQPFADPVPMPRHYEVHVYRSAARSDHRDVFGHGTIVWRFEYLGVKS